MRTNNPVMDEPDSLPAEQPGATPIHKRRVLLRPRHFAALEALAKEKETDVAEEANRAVREMLEREGRWPPKSDAK